ncbi:hypothetical protein TRVA0_002S03840 [Trichomonascus vanleenenianus]|uniref:uncharacterized protein n=1 Tax=Trichomonascus vanleenenianus TaxID=2268995 RepID=UPI003ECB7263
MPLRERRVSAPGPGTEDPPSKVSKSTSNSYRIYQKRFQRWCLEHGTNDIIDQDKLAGFLQSLSERPNRYDPKKKIGYPTLAQATSALCILYRDQVERGINNNPNPRDENVNLILSNSKGTSSTSNGSPARRKRGRPARMSAPQPTIDSFINSPATGRVVAATSPPSAGSSKLVHSSPLSSPHSASGAKEKLDTLEIGSRVAIDESWRSAISPQDLVKLVKTSYTRSTKEGRDTTITSIPESARNRAYLLFGYKTKVDCNIVSKLKLTDLDVLVPSALDPSFGSGPAVFSFNLNRDRARAASRSEYLYAVREKDPRFCFIGALAWYLFVRFQVLDEVMPNPGLGKFYWYREFVFKRHTPGNSSLVKQLLVLFDAAKIEMPSFLQEAKFGKKADDEFDVERFANPANDNEEEAERIRLLPFGHDTAGQRRIQALEYARTSVEPSDRLLRMVFPKLDGIEDEVVELYRRNESRDDAAFGFIRFMKEMRRVILQDAAVVVDYHRNDALFNADVFHTREFAQFAKEVRQKAGITAPFKLTGRDKDLSDYEDVGGEAEVTREEEVSPVRQAENVRQAEKVPPPPPTEPQIPQVPLDSQDSQDSTSSNPRKRRYSEDNGTSEQLKLLNENTTMLRNQLAQTSTDLRGVMEAVNTMKRDIDILKLSKSSDQSQNLNAMTSFIDHRVTDLTRDLTANLNRSMQQLASSLEQGRSNESAQAMNNEMMAQYMAMMRSNPAAYYGYQPNMWWPQYGYMPSPVQQPPPHEMTPQQQQQQQPPPSQQPPPQQAPQQQPPHPPQQQGPPPQQQQGPPLPPQQQQQQQGPPPQHYQQQQQQIHQSPRPSVQQPQPYPAQQPPPHYQQQGMAHSQSMPPQAYPPHPQQQGPPPQMAQEMQQMPLDHQQQPGTMYYPSGGGHPMYAQLQGPGGGPVYMPPQQYIPYQPPQEDVQRSQMGPQQPQRERRRSLVDPSGRKAAQKQGGTLVRKVQKVPLTSSKTSPRREEKEAQRSPDTIMANSNAERTPQGTPSRAEAPRAEESEKSHTSPARGIPEAIIAEEEASKDRNHNQESSNPGPNATIEEITIESSDKEDEDDGDKNGTTTATSSGSVFGSATTAIAAAAANIVHKAANIADTATANIVDKATANAVDKAKSTSPPTAKATNDEDERQTD